MLRKLELDRILSFLAFTLSLAVYLLTLERTVSLWDCGEFIAAASGLQVGHPPGAPLFAMVGRLFAAMAPNAQSVALFVNAFSALVSALTVLFLYKSIVLLFDITLKDEFRVKWMPQLAAFAAAMAFAFTDTFWFSAVEAEVYAFSVFFTAVCFWASLKWYTTEGGSISSRWLILIAYLCGLSYGVHLLNLLILPAISYLVISRCYHLTFWRKVLAVVASSLAVGLVLYFFVPFLLMVISGTELLFVNHLGLPYNTGTLTGVVLIFGAFGYGIWYTYHRGHVRSFTFTLGFALFTLGFGSYAMVLVRGTQNPPMNQNQVDNIFSLKSYLDRDQYGEAPLLYGPYYSAPVKETVDSKPIYVKIDGHYEVKGYTQKKKYYASHCTLFPRMYSDNPNHIEDYRSWAMIGQEDSVAYHTEKGKALKAIKPTFAQNLTFFAGYQMWWMYFRYLLWNFAGRQNDIPGQGNILNGNWISGIPVLDNLLLGPQDALPDSYKNNKAHNRYFLIPLILGFLGMFYQSKRHEDAFLSTLLLFFFTGIAIVLFLNQVPGQVRERDYAYVGSFYVFAIWIGYGMVYLIKKLERIKLAKLQPAVAVAFLAVPTLVLAQNYDDHDRSGRSIALSYAKNFLNSVPTNSLLMVYGDNDTFPLWYAQMVEGVRQDVKVFNSNYMYTTWNPVQLAQKTYTNDAFKLRGKDIYALPNELRYAVCKDSAMPPVPLHVAVPQLLSEYPDNRVDSPFSDGRKVHYLPQKVIILPGLKAVDSSNIYLTDNQLITRDQLVYLDIISNNYLSRSISFAQTVPPGGYKLIKGHLFRVGLNNQLVICPADSVEVVSRRAALASYSYLMKGFTVDKFSKSRYYDDFSKRLVSGYRIAFIKTAKTLLAMGDTACAAALTDRCLKVIPADIIPLGMRQGEMVDLLLNLNKDVAARKLVSHLMEENVQLLRFVSRLNSFQKSYVLSEKALALQNLNSMAKTAREHGATDVALKLELAIAQYDK
jgi:hypothetical protein